MENTENEVSREFIDEMVSDALIDEEETGSEDENDSQFIPKSPTNPKGAGRPRGTKKKKIEVEERAVNASPIYAGDIDPFDLAREWINTKCEAVLIKILRAGAFLEEVNFSLPKDKIKIKSLADVQEKLGEGIYTFVVQSINTGKIIAQRRMQILPRPEVVSPKETEKDNSLDSILSSLGSTNDGDNQPNQNVNNINIPKPQSLVSQIKELLPIIVAVAPLVKDFMTPKTPQGPTIYELQKDFEEKLDRERKRMREEQDRIDKMVEQRLEEKMERMGVGPEKSTMEEISDIIKNVGDIVVQKTKVQAEMMRPIEGPKVSVMPPKTQQLTPVEKVIQHLMKKVSEGMDADQLCEYCAKTEKIKVFFQKNDKNFVASEAIRLLNLNSEQQSLLTNLIDKIYDRIGQKPA